MKNAKLVAWGMIISLGIITLTAMELLDEVWYQIGGLGFWVFSIWAIILLFKNANQQS